MALEDFNTYTEVDAGSYITKNQYSVVGSTPSNQTNYVYKDFGAGYFPTALAFEHKIEITFSPGGNDAGCGLYSIANGLARIDSSTHYGAGAITLSYYHADNGNLDYLFLTVYNTSGATIGSHEYNDFQPGTKYWVKIDWDPSIGSYGRVRMRFYTDSSYTTLAVTLSTNLTGTIPSGFRYAYAGSGLNNGASVSASWTVEDFEFPVKPTVTTQAVSAISRESATGNGNVTDEGLSDVTKKGFVWDTASQSLPGNVAPGSSGYDSSVEATGSFDTGAFTNSLTGLLPATVYYVRSYAYNAMGYSYGSEVSFTTSKTRDPVGKQFGISVN